MIAPVESETSGIKRLLKINVIQHDSEMDDDIVMTVCI